jgi:hypothetical protein
MYRRSTAIARHNRQPVIVAAAARLESVGAAAPLPLAARSLRVALAFSSWWLRAALSGDEVAAANDMREVRYKACVRGRPV